MSFNGYKTKIFDCLCVVNYRYNFHKVHCAEALEVAAENIEKALEILFLKYFKIDFQDKPAHAPNKNELIEMVNDERAVLDSIYDTSFKTKDNNIWIVKLNLDYLTKMYESKEVDVPQKKNSNYTSSVKTKQKEVCKLFLRGPCRFGAKCKFLHESKEDKVPEPVEPKENTKITYELEIRFPDDSVYPYQPPLIFFKTENKTKIIPELTCLKITLRLIDEAKILAQDGIPCVYSLVELLNNEEEILNFIQFDTRTFPDTTDALFPQLIENSGSKKNLPSHYKKGGNRDNRANINFEEIFRENKEIAKRFAEKRDNDRYNRMMSGRKKLPAWKKRNEILNTIKKSQVSCLLYFFFL